MEVSGVVKYILILIVGIATLYYLNSMPGALATILNDDFSETLFWIGMLGLCLGITIFTPALDIDIVRIANAFKMFLAGIALTLFINFTASFWMDLIAEELEEIAWLILIIVEVMGLVVMPVMCLVGDLDEEANEA